MDRFDPYSHPDHFAFEDDVRKIRSREIDQFFQGLGTWVIQQERALAQRLTHLGHSLRHHQPARHS